MSVTGGYNELDRQEASRRQEALATRISSLVEQVGILTFRVETLTQDVEDNNTNLKDLSKKLMAIEIASSKPLWMSAGIAAAALVIGWLLNAWDGIGKILHK
jgi:uncharacterized protein YlxW (UPF0749 family)